VLFQQKNSGSQGRGCFGGSGAGYTATDYNDVGVGIHWICMPRLGTASSPRAEGWVIAARQILIDKAREHARDTGL